MSPRHFAKYRQTNPKEYETFSNNMWNGFVTITHKVGLKHFFSFTPDFSEYRAKNGGDQTNPNTKSL